VIGIGRKLTVCMQNRPELQIARNELTHEFLEN